MARLRITEPEQARRVGRYWQILMCLAERNMTRRSLALAMRMSKSPHLIMYINDLLRSGYITQYTDTTRNGLMVYYYDITQGGLAALLHLAASGEIEVEVEHD